GLTTNLRFLGWLVREPVVRDGQARTDTLGRIWPPDDWTARTTVPDAAWTAAARALLADEDDRWASGFRLNASPAVRLSTDHETRLVRVDGTAPGPAAELIRVDDEVHIDLGGRSTAFRIAAPPDVDRAASKAAAAHGTGPIDLVAPMPGRVIAIVAAVGTRVTAGEPIMTLEAMKLEHAVAAPLGGAVADLEVRVGQQVQRGQRLGTVAPD
ncbi:MAG: acetyl-CoA carboxylase biotin carboxyl carrier protein subunit, partial [Candidatus Limnocylindrales bacterium]